MPDTLTTAPAPPLAAAPLASPVEDDAGAGRRLVRRARLWAALVLLAGVVAGGAGFALEQRFMVWKPQLSETADGWRVAGGPGLRPLEPAVAGGHAAWRQGGYTCLLDLDTGDVKVINVVSSAVATSRLQVSDRYVVWLDSPRRPAWSENPGKGMGPSAIWAYDIERGRRWQVQLLLEPPGFDLALDDDRVAWIAPSRTRVPSVDLGDGTQTDLRDQGTFLAPLLLDGPALAWQSTTPSPGLTLEVLDLGSGRLSQVHVPTPPRGYLVKLQLSGGRVLSHWQDDATADSSVTLVDVAGGASETVTRGDVGAAALDGDLVVWAEGAGRGSRIMGRRDGEAPFELRTLPYPVIELALGDGTVVVTGDDASGTTVLTTFPVVR